MDVLVEVLKELLTGGFHAGLDALVHLSLEVIERLADLVRRPALLVDRENSLLEIDARVHRSEDFV